MDVNKARMRCTCARPLTSNASCIIKFLDTRPPVQHIDLIILLQFTGVITTKSRIDYESIKQIQLRALVTDTGIPQLTSTAEITVDVINTNDNDPVFNSTEYKLRVMENSAKGTIVGKVDAADMDDGME